MGAAPAATTYYRLQQLDIDGTATYSPVVAVAGSEAAAPSLLAWPVPARHTLWVRYDAAAQVRLQLRDATGRVVRQLTFQQQTQLDVRNLPAGIYYLQAYADGRELPTATQKLLITP